MKNLFSIVLLFLLVGEGNAQLSTQDRLNSCINEAEKYLSFFEATSAKKAFDCPPKISNSNSSPDTSLRFLSFLADAFEVEKKMFLTKMMEKECQAYYTLKTLHAHYAPTYSKLLKEFDIPEEYALVPLVISAANPNLRIEGNKAGIWQLNYINARRFGLRIDHTIDDRFDITRSTLAAIQYILFLEEYFEGNKLKALCAFYSSVPYVKKVTSKLSTYSDEAFIHALNEDVLNFLIYYYSWNEWNRIFKDAKVDDPIAKSEKGMKKLVLRDSVSIAILAEFLGLELDYIRSINPMWVGEWLTDESESYAFVLPKEKTDFITNHYAGFTKFHAEKLQDEKDALLALKKRIKDDIPDPNRYKAMSYKVRSGDVLGLIAQRYGVKVSDIKKWNKLSSDRINIGQVLVLYVLKSTKAEAEKHDQEEMEDLAEEKIEVENREPKPGKGTYTNYIVKQGESLWIIARKFPGVSSENIMEWNGITDKIKPGQELKIYEGD